MARLPDYLIVKSPLFLSDGKATMTIELNWKHPGLYRFIWGEIKKANRDKSSVELMQTARYLVQEKHERGCYGR